MPKARLTSAFSSASLVLLASLAGAQTAGDVVKVADRDVTIAWPSFPPREPLPGNVDPDPRTTGGWRSLQAKWKALPAATTPPYKVLVVIPRQTARLTVRTDSILSVQSMISGVENDDIYQALALYKVAVEVFSNGATRVEFEVQPDDDLGFAIDGVSNLQDEITRFASVRASHTPVTVAGSKSPAGYEFAFVVYDSRQPLTLPTSLNGIPSVALPFRLFSVDGSGPNLSSRLFDAWWSRLAPKPAEPTWANALAGGIPRNPEDRSPFTFSRPLPGQDGPSFLRPGELSADMDTVTVAGDFKAETGSPMKVRTGTRWHARGRALVGTVQAAKSDAKSLAVSLRVSGPDVFDLVLRDPSGAEVARWPVANRALSVGAVYLAPSDADAQVRLPVTAQAKDCTLWVEESSLTREFGRQGSEESIISVGSPTYAAEPAIAPAPATEPAKGSKEGLASKDATIQAASARLYWTTKDLLSEPVLLTLAKSGSPDVAYAACEALARQETPTALAMLKKVMVDGPFEANRYLALRALSNHGVKLTTAELWRTLGSNSWRTRALSTMLAAQSDSKDKNVVLATMLIDAEPAVRETVAEVADPNDEALSKRLLFLAFNDVSDSVRLAATRKLLQSKESRVRAETLKLVRDDSVYVATSVLKLLADQTDAADLDAIRLALVDRRPLVQACGLLVGAQRAGDWTTDDVRPTFKSTDPRVQEALLTFAVARPKTVPSEVLEKIASGNDAWLAERAKRILGSGS